MSTWGTAKGLGGNKGKVQLSDGIGHLRARYGPSRQYGTIGWGSVIHTTQGEEEGDLGADSAGVALVEGGPPAAAVELSARAVEGCPAPPADEVPVCRVRPAGRRKGRRAQGGMRKKNLAPLTQ